MLNVILQAATDSTVKIALDTGKELGQNGALAVGIVGGLWSMLSNFKKFPFPKDLRHVAAVIIGAAGGAGVLHNPLLGIVSSALFAVGGDILTHVPKWFRDGMKWAD